METKTWIGIFLLAGVVLTFLLITWFFYSYWNQRPLPIIDPEERRPTPPPTPDLPEMETTCVVTQSRGGSTYYEMRIGEGCLRREHLFAFQSPKEPIEGQTSTWCIERQSTGFDGGFRYYLYNQADCFPTGSPNVLHVYTSSEFAPGLTPIYFYTSVTGMRPSLTTQDSTDLSYQGMGYILPL